MMLWIIFACLVAGAVAAVSAPLFRVRQQHAKQDEIDVYVSQLRELDRDVERGLISAAEAEESRNEIARRILRARKVSTAGSSNVSAWLRRHQGLAFGLIAGFVSIGSLAIYLTIGSPALPAFPLSARLEGPAESQPINVLVAKVEKRLAEHPEDAAGWTVIAPVYLKLGQFEKAAEAYLRSIALAGETAEKYLGLGEALASAQNGIVTDDAERAFKAALDRDPSSIRARFWLALRDEQNGKLTEARAAYEALSGEEIPAEWKDALTRRITLLGGQPAQAADERQSGASSADREEPGAQRQFARQMVESLAKRLKEDGSDLAGWLMLVRSYAVLGEVEKARNAFSSAKAQFENEPDALRQIEDLGRSLGLVS